ncbi:MAG TPA: nucleoside triphosphate pyrophosphohydrolase [Thermoanaerobaculia bacterium]|nr:nucleoside triphosphate pyrophosphohydrolase [Thermoanaerobaculia bacterium]
MSEEKAHDLATLDALVARLRGPDGCPWDREQGFDDIRAYLLEEAHEVAAAIDRRDWAELEEELGDLLFQLAFLGRMSEEQGRPGLARSIASVEAKMIERHPHVFGETSEAAAAAATGVGDGSGGSKEAGYAGSRPLDADAVAAAWERRKLQSRGREASLLDGLAASMPSLLAAYRMTQKAAGVGFDWSTAGEVLAKVKEELGELEHALEHDRDRARDEIGDLLFAIANLARHLGIDPEAAAARTNLKFRRRFRHIEDRLREQGRRLDQSTLGEMDALWDEAKQREAEEAVRSGDAD